jgi:hypothetical protein
MARHGRRRGHARLGGDQRGGGRTTAVARSDSDVRTPAVGGARGKAVSGGGVVGRRAAVGTDTCGPDSTFKVRRSAWQPRGDGALTGRPGAERGRLTGGSHASVISKIKFTHRQK